MIKLDPPSPDDPLWQRWRSECDSATQALVRFKEERTGDPVEIDRRLYRRDSIIKRYYHDGKAEQHFAPFHGKCVYCEAGRTILHVEHYRPKKAVPDANSRVTTDGSKQAHPGYYWLAYEVDNLLLACEDCNVGFKGDQFPLEDESKRAWASTDELDKEEPLLLNPFDDDPSEHLSIDLDTGVLAHKTTRGDRTIELLGLNLRRLPEQRRQAITEIEKLWSQWHALDSTSTQQQRAFERLKSHKLGRFEFTLTARLTLAHLHERTKKLSAELET